MNNINTLPSLVEIPHLVPEGDPVMSYEFMRPPDKGHAFSRPHVYNASVPTEWQFNERNYRGKFMLLATLPKQPKDGDVITLGAYRMRVIESVPWLDATVCVLDKPLSRLYVWQAKADYGYRLFEVRLWRTLRLWGVIDWNSNVDVSSNSRYPRITHIFGRKVK